MTYEHWSKEAQEMADELDAVIAAMDNCPEHRTPAEHKLACQQAYVYWIETALNAGYIIRPEFRGMRPNPDNPMEWPT